MALDIETKNFAHEIGGWNNTHMFIPSVVCTWDGTIGKIYIDKEVDDMVKSTYTVKPMRELKFDLDDHFEKGGKILGHNIVGFDLPILRDSMDIYCIRKYLKDDTTYIDTSKALLKETGERFPLSNLVKHTLGDNKLMDWTDIPIMPTPGAVGEIIKKIADKETNALVII